jgi:hypothetical protein
VLSPSYRSRGGPVDVSPALAAEFAVWALVNERRHMPQIF